MDISLIDDTLDPVVYAVALSAEEAATLSRVAWARMARVLKVSEDAVRERAEAMLTPAEIVRFENESIMACAAEQAMAAVGRTYMMAPEVEAFEESVVRENEGNRAFPDESHKASADAGASRETPGHGKPHGNPPENTASEGGETSPEANPDSPLPRTTPLRFMVSVHPVPAMELDLRKPIPHSPEEPDAERAARALRARLHGTIPEALLRTALAAKREEFDRELAEAGITYREYRIENNMKPQDVQDALYDEAFDQLSEDIALDLVYLRVGLEVRAEDEQAVLASIAPEKRDDFKRDLRESGHVCLFHQKTRRHAALRWATENLMEQ